MIRCLIRLRSAMCCTGGRSANATNDYVGKGSSPWCREFELARVISFDSYLDRTGGCGQLQRRGGGTFDPLTGLVALSTFQHRYACGQFIALLSFKRRDNEFTDGDVFHSSFSPDCGANPAGSIAHGCGSGPGSQQAEHNPAPCTGWGRWSGRHGAFSSVPHSPIAASNQCPFHKPPCSEKCAIVPERKCPVRLET